jgi:hypothetical protein
MGGGRYHEAIPSSVDMDLGTADTSRMKTSPNDTSTLDAVVATVPAEPAAATVANRTTLRMRSGIKAGAFNRGGGVYG